MIRELLPLELAEIVKIVETHRSQQFNWDEQKILAQCKTCLCMGYFAERNELLAFALFLPVSNSTRELIVLATKKGFEGQGLMKDLLLNQLTQEPKIEFWLEVHEKNKNAIHLYNSLGFRRVGERKSYYFDGSKAILMSKILEQV